MQEKRKHQRHKRELDVRYSCAKGPLIIESTSTTRDISAGGLRLPLDDTLTMSDRVKLSVTLPWKKHPLDAIAKIVWASPKLVTGDLTIKRDCGLEFLWASIPDLGNIIKA